MSVAGNFTAAEIDMRVDSEKGFNQRIAIDAIIAQRAKACAPAEPDSPAVERRVDLPRELSKWRTILKWRYLNFPDEGKMDFLALTERLVAEYRDLYPPPSEGALLIEHRKEDGEK